MSRHSNQPDRLPCNQALVVMGHHSYDAPPTEWRTRQAACQTCGAGFHVTADEQRFWYEELRIPFIVSINHCLSCRGRQRTHRRIIAKLSRLLPRIDRGEADIDEEREAVLTIAEGMINRLATHPSLDIPILSGTTVVERAAALITRLRRTSAAHDDLLPVAINIQRRLEHPRRIERLEAELAVARQRSVVMDRAIRTMAAWLKTPTKALRDRILDPPRA